jgi:Family of unknown function (DUF6415)
MTLEPWSPPMDAEALTHLIDKMRIWTPLDGPALLDDVASVLDILPLGANVEAIAQRLRGHLAQLLNITGSARSAQDSEYVESLVRRSQTLWARELPRRRTCALCHLRQMAWVTGELLDQLVAFHVVKEVT